MAKKGMKRYYNDTNKNETNPVPELQGKVKSGKEKANPEKSDYLDFSQNNKTSQSSAFGLAGSDYVLENIANDLGLTAADLQDFIGTE